MEIDLNKFLPTFIEESVELLQEMEQALLALDAASLDLEKINQAFRAVHTLKSSGAAFNFVAIAKFAHAIENFLEPVRAQQQQLTQEEISLLLRTVDCLRKMISDAAEKQPIDNTLAQTLMAELSGKDAPASETPAAAPSQPPATPALAEKPNAEETPALNEAVSWDIQFIPDHDIWKNGNEPLRVFQALSQLGTYSAQLNADKLPDFFVLDPETCYLQWTLKLYANVTKTEILEIFRWVSAEKNIQISSSTPVAENVATPNAATEKTAVATAQKSLTPVEPKAAEVIDTATAPAITSIRVKTDKIDSLINLVGELVITKSILSQIGKDFTVDKLQELQQALELLEHNTRELQESAIQIRMLPIGGAFSRFPRVIHDLADQMHKKVQLVISGEQTEIDRSIMEKITDPLLHLIRNSVDHGIETPDVRKQLDKPEVGTISINTYQSGGNIIIDISDDGRGLNFEKIRAKAIENGLMTAEDEFTHDKIFAFIFHAGFSTAEVISDVSGRGVGMDVVYRSIHDLGGSIDLKTTENIGTTFSLRLPLTLAILECQLVKVEAERYCVPLMSIVEIIKIDMHNVSSADDKTQLYYLRKIYVPIIYLTTIFGTAPVTHDLTDKYLIVVEVNGQFYGLLCDEVLSQQQIVIKSLQDNFEKVPGIAGATILGDGSVTLILDVNTIVDIFRNAGKEDILADHAELAIHEKRQLETDPTKKMLFLGFHLDGKEYAVNILDVLEIRNNQQPLTPLPNVPPYIKGVMNLRGLIVPVADLQDRLALQQVEYNAKDAIIVLDIPRGHLRKVVGILVDSVSDTYNLTSAAIKPLPEGGVTAIADFVMGLAQVNHQTITLLYADSLIGFSGAN